jgi:hypothetical protein
MSIFDFPKYFWKKKIIKNCKNCETIKFFKLWSLKKVFQNCDDKFFVLLFLYIL